MAFTRIGRQWREGMTGEQRLATGLVLLVVLSQAVVMVLISSADRALKFLAVQMLGRALTDDGLVAVTELVTSAIKTTSVILLLVALTAWSAGRSKAAALRDFWRERLAADPLYPVNSGGRAWEEARLQSLSCCFRLQNFKDKIQGFPS